MADNPIKLCFIALGAYPLLKGEKPKIVIGPDVHQLVLIKELKKYGYKISVVTYGPGRITTEYINDIEIIKIPPDYRLRGLNIASKVFHIWRGIRIARADIYFHAGGAPGVTSLFCIFARKKYIYSIASDALAERGIISENVSGFNKSRFSLANLGNWLDIKLAHIIIVQNEYQRANIRKNFKRDATLIKMPFPIIKEEKSEKANPPIVLWVGAIADVKQPELFVKLAEAIPEARFQMIGGHYEQRENLYYKIKDANRAMSNFEYLGAVPFEKIDQYFSHASVLVNTSIFEGFPNAFVQAWMHHTPVVSLNADPDELICRNKMGFHSKTFGQLVADVKILLEDEELCNEMAINARKYAAKDHNLEVIINKYIGIFNRL